MAILIIKYTLDRFNNAQIESIVIYNQCIIVICKDNGR